MAQGLEERRNSQRRDHDGDIIILADDPPEQVLQSKYKTEVDQSQQDGQRAVDDGALNKQINVIASKGEEVEGKLSKNAWMMKSSRISLIQRGTSRPLGKSRKNTPREIPPRKFMRLRGIERAG